MFEIKLKIVCTVIGWLGVLVNGGLSAYCIVALNKMVQAEYPADVSIGLIVYSCILMSLVFHFISSVLVIISTKTNSRLLLLPWIINTVIDLILVIAAASVWQLFYGLITLPLLIIAEVLIILYYKELRNENTPDNYSLF